MAHSLSLEQVATIANLDPVVKAQVALCGWNSLYTMDSIVRRYTDKSLTMLYSDIGDLGVSSVELDAGIGKLLLSKDSAVFIPCAGVKHEVPHMTDVHTKLERQETCAGCSKLLHGRCSIAGCGCNGMGSVDRLYSKCPLGLWKK
jgi:hypothetical protein